MRWAATLIIDKPTLAGRSPGVNAGTARVARGRGPERGAMATVRITYWRDIPMLVTARDGGDEVSVPLSPAFQDLVDRVAMQEGLGDEDAYLAEWHVGPPEDAPGRPARWPRTGPARSRPDSTRSATAIFVAPGGSDPRPLAAREGGRMKREPVVRPRRVALPSARCSSGRRCPWPDGR